MIVKLHVLNSQALTPEQIAEKQHQDLIGVGMFGIFLVLFIGLIIFGEKNIR